MALGRLFSALPVRQGDPKDQIEVYVLALRDVTHHALDEVIFQAISGQHPSLSKRFAPTTAELGDAVRETMAFVQKQVDIAAERLVIADQRPAVVRPMLFMERAERDRKRMRDEGRALLFTVANIDQLKTRSRELPKDFGYIATTGEVWGPPGSAKTADPVPELADQDVPW